MNIDIAPSRPSATEARHRVYFALQPDGPAAEQIASVSAVLASRLGPRAQPVSPARWHISLAFLHGGEAAPGPAVLTTAGRIAAEVDMPPFLVALDRVTSWNGWPQGPPRSRPLVLRGEDGVMGIEMLAAKLRGALSLAGVPQGPKRVFNPHLTLFWGEHSVPEQSVAPVRWPVCELVLLHTWTGRQVVLERWPLKARA